MNLYLKCLLVAAIIANLFHTAFAILCYDCNTMENPECFDNFIGAVINCDFAEPTSFRGDPRKQNLKANSCMQIDIELDDNRTEIVRTCNWEYHYYVIDPSIQYRSYSRRSCYDDLCNSSTVPGPIAFTAVLFIIFARMLS